MTGRKPACHSLTRIPLILHIICLHFSYRNGRVPFLNEECFGLIMYKSGEFNVYSKDTDDRHVRLQIISLPCNADVNNTSINSFYVHYSKQIYV
jgi:hypothetical protein